MSDRRTQQLLDRLAGAEFALVGYRSIEVIEKRRAEEATARVLACEAEIEECRKALGRGRR